MDVWRNIKVGDKFLFDRGTNSKVYREGIDIYEQILNMPEVRIKKNTVIDIIRMKSTSQRKYVYFNYKGGVHWVFWKDLRKLAHKVVDKPSFLD